MSRRKDMLRKLEEDIRRHIEDETRENVERGMEPEAARTAALRKFGNITRLREETRAVWTWVWLEQILQDLRYGLRMLRRNPGFTAIVVATLACGIGMNTAVFSAVDAVLLRALTYPDAGRLVWLAKYDKEYQPNQDNRVICSDYSALKERTRAFASMAGYSNDDLALKAEGRVSQERIASITGDFWQLTNAQAALGRLFAPGEAHAIVLTDAFYKRRFGGNAHVIGKTITLNGYPFTVVGVLGAGFQFLLPQQWVSGDERRDIDAYIPVPQAVLTMPVMNWRAWEAVKQRVGPASGALCVIGKLKPGVSLDRARNEIETVYRRMAAEDPSIWHTHEGVRIQSLKRKLAGSARYALMVLAAAVGFVLLIACANVANLLLSRASARQRETAIRGSLGAGRRRITRQLLVEGVLLALLGGAAGLLLARWALAVLVRLGSGAVPRLSGAMIDGRVLLFTLGISVVAGVLFGLAPLLTMWKADLHTTLKNEPSTSSGGKGQLRMRGILVAAELGLAIVLLTGAGLMLKSFWRMNANPAGFAPEKILVMNISLNTQPYVGSWPKQEVYLRAILERLQSAAGVRAVGLDCGTLHTSIGLQGATSERQTAVAIRAVSPGYLRTLGVPLLRGHWPTKSEELDAFAVNESFARQIDDGRDPLGKQLKGSFLNERIAAVVPNFKYQQLDEEPLPEIYMAYQIYPNIFSVRVLVRTDISPKAALPVIRKIIQSIDPNQPIYDVETLEQALSESIAPRRFNMFLLEIFAATALILALVGIYGAMAYSVVHRTHEIGIRMALGAGRGQVIGMIVRKGLAIASIGIAGGSVAALGLTRLMASLLYRVKPNDPETFAAVAAMLAITALLASFGPALKAALVDPLVALRHE